MSKAYFTRAFAALIVALACACKPADADSVRPAHSQEDAQLAFAASGAAAGSTSPEAGAAGFTLAVFADPPRSEAPGVRWIWPGGAVDDATIDTEIARIAQAGYGMIELQTLVAALSEQEMAADPSIRSVGEPAFLAHVRTLAASARAHGLGYDLTLGSGWPNGGVGVPSAAQEQQLTCSRLDVMGPTPIDIAVPAPEAPSWVTAPVSELLTAIGLPTIAALDPSPQLRALIAAPILDAAAEPPVLGLPFEITEHVQAGRLRWQVPSGAHALLALYQSHTSHTVLGAAFPGTSDDARVIDHLGRAGADWVVAQQLRPWLAALGPDRPQHLFIDSLELAGDLPWSDSLSKQVGYVDVPFLLRAGGETKYAEVLSERATPAFAAGDALHAERAREEYEQVRAERFQREYLANVVSAAHEGGVALRVQAHGGWGVLLDDYAAVDVPESESLFAGGSFDFLSLASSAAHVAGRPKASLESFVTLNLLGPSALDQDALWRLAGHAFSAGINQLVHSVAVYPYRHATGEPWYPLATFTSQIDPGSAAWSFLPAFNRAQARISYALTRGTPRTDLAWLKTARAQWDNMVLAAGGVNTIGEESPESQALRAAGFTYDRVSPRMLAQSAARERTLQIGAANYRALLVDDARALDPEVLEAIAQLAQAGVPIVWLGPSPERAPGLRERELRDARVHAAWSRVQAQVTTASAARELPAALRTAGVTPEVEAPGLFGMIGHLQRDTEAGRIVWFFNEGALPERVLATLRPPPARGWWLDPERGSAAEVTFDAGSQGANFWLALPAGRGGLLWLPE